MIQHFKIWATKQLARFNGLITESNESVRIDIDTEKSVARITLWEGGSYVAEVIDIETEENIYLISGEIISSNGIENEFAEFIKVLSKN